MNGNTTHNVPNATQRSEQLLDSIARRLHDGTLCARQVGELDIVSRDDTGIIVFVEVKTRRTLRYGTPQEAVTSSKQINLRHAAVQWLSDSDHRTPHNGVRFDVVTVIVRDGKPLVHHIEGAF